jgi:FdrA protein
MGPDCGTAVVGGVGLGFANQVRLGSISLVGASGTGLQTVMCRIYGQDAGISHAIGTGGRDLSREVGGITASQGLDLLRRDPETRAIVLISKPPAPEVAAHLLALARSTGKPVAVQFLGAPSPARKIDNLYFASSLGETAELAVWLSEDEPPREPVVPFAQGRYLRGLFAGGTLAYEVLRGLAAVLSPVWSNTPLTESQRLADPARSQGHTILDLGADELTVGRLHPMIDQELRLRRLRQEAADPEIALILLDLVLGYGAHADPAGELAPVIADVLEAARSAGRELDVAAVIIGTDEDPQDLAGQIETLERAGARVFRSVGKLVDYAARRFGPVRHGEGEGSPVPLADLGGPLAAVNVGLESFYDSLVSQGARAVHVEWKPPAGGDEKLARILARMKGR